MTPPAPDPSLHSRVSVLVRQWVPILGIHEHLTIQVEEIEPADGSDDVTECAMLPASVVPEAAGRWDFVLAVSPVCDEKDDHDLERVIVHELVHLLMEPLRDMFFAARPQGMVYIPDPGVTLWETVIERLTSTFIRIAS